MISEAQIQAIVARIVEGYQPDRIILFGSYAYGTPTEDSDLDLLVVKGGEKRPVWERMAAIEKLFVRSKAPAMDVVVVNSEEARRYSRGRYGIEAFALQNGRELYAAA
ncbi:nucleotidyltransferase domain-containing protein [uncultured Hymenobacter sp.]|uniref:nucleotidyltransferase domain-containing protein n=1 Tax=uncultured Hymenobacter sp. TaxID=170016 RepID=UPI0035CC860B